MKKYFKLFLLSFIFLMMPMCVFAQGSATVSFAGDGTVTEGKTITLKLQVSGISGLADKGIVSFGGNLSFDSNYLQYISGKGVSSPYSFQINPDNSYKIAGLDTTLSNGIKSTTSVMTFQFKALKSGSTKVSFTNGKLTDNLGIVSTNIQAKNITIKEPASTNNDLSSLSVDGYSINFNKNTTSYKVNVKNDVTSVNISAKADDSKASISGTGSKSLNYGSNTVKVVVQAEDGSKKTYTINIVREDNRSSNNNLSSMTVTNGTLSPSFSKGTTSYSIEVPYSVSSLNIKYETEDKNAKVNISGNSLVAEKTVTVSVTVTAENGNRKTYSIKASRGKDPNKKLSTNNNLRALSIDVGILSPVFDSSKTNYIVYLPYEIDDVNFSAEVSDKDYATIEWKKPTNLGVGENIYEANVKAEDGSIKTYKIIVVRGASLEDPKTSGNAGLKSLSIENGKLKTSFSSNIHFYTYTKGNEALKINAVATDVNATVNVLNDGDVYTVLVEAASGDKTVYVFVPEEIKDNLFIYIGIGAGIFLIILIIILLIIILKKKKKEKENN